MNLSFLSPNPKELLSPISFSWLLCFLASALLILGIWLLLGWQSQRFIAYSQALEMQTLKDRSSQESLASNLAFLELQLKKLQEVKAQNSSLVGAIQNLFDLVPDQITINAISLTDESLTIKGITPSKELYTFLLQAPLRAIFSESRVDFFVLPSGWYNFVSVSKVIQDKRNGQ